MNRCLHLALFSLFTLLLTAKLSVAQQWSVVGTRGFSPGGIQYWGSTIVTDNSGTPYVAFSDFSQSGKATVMKYNGSNWVIVGNAGFTVSGAYYGSFTIDKNGTLYFAYQDDAYSGKASVMKFNGTSWVSVGNPGFSAGVVSFTSVAVDNNNVPYIAYKDAANGDRGTVMKYNGSSWVTVGNPGFSAGEVEFITLAIDNSNTPFLAYKDWANGAGPTVMKFNGSAWVVVGSTNISSSICDDIWMSLDKTGMPYVAYRDANLGGKASVKKYNGTAWVSVGNPAISAGVCFRTTVKIDNNGTPWLAYIDYANGSKAIVMRYNGSKWVPAGQPWFTVAGIYEISLALTNNGLAYVSMSEDPLNGKATVMRLDCSYTTPKTDICAVLTDTVTGINQIIWKSSALHVDSYKVYRENGSSYIFAGGVKGNSFNFSDAGVSSVVQSYRYKLTVLDSCGRETDVATVTPHKTIRLVFNHLFAGKASISWNAYQGIANPTYIVKRSNNNAPFTAIASFGIKGNDTTYIDAAAPTGSNRYRIDIALTAPCTAGSVSYSTVTSNIVTSWNTSVADTDQQQINIFPNPADNSVMVRATAAIDKVELFDFTGHKLSSAKGDGKTEVTIDLRAMPAGLYLIKINDVHQRLFTKR